MLNLNFLDIILRNKDPKILESKKKLLKEEQKINNEIFKNEEFMLEQITLSSSNILENESLIDCLKQTKAKSQLLNDNIKKSAQIKSNIQKNESIYFPTSLLIADIFLRVRSLKSINPFFRFSFKFFENLINLTFK